MPFSKNSPANPKKQAPVPGPRSTAYKQFAGAGKSVSRKSSSGHSGAAATKSCNKRPKLSAAFSSLKSRQRIVERVKRAIWASVLEINDAIINLALCGNYNAARALFDFAGVYSLPASESNESAASPAPSEPAAAAFAPPVVESATPNAIDAFFRSIGVEPSIEEPEPGVAV